MIWDQVAINQITILSISRNPINIQTTLWYQMNMGCKGLRSLLGVTFFKNAQTFLYFGIAGGMCASSLCHSFKNQLNLFPAKLILPSFFWSFSWHMRIWALSYLKKNRMIWIRELAYNLNLFNTYWFRNNKDEWNWPNKTLLYNCFL